MFRSKFLRLLVVSVLLLVFASSALVDAQTRLTRIRVAHLSPDTPAVEVFLNGQPSGIQVLSFGQISGWVEVPAGTYSVAVAPAGAGIEAAAIGPANFTLPANGWVTVSAIGSLGRGTLRAATLAEPIRTLDAETTSVTVFHGIEDAPAVDVILPDGTRVVSNLPFGRGTTVRVPAGVYDLRVVPAGATSPVVLNLAGTRLNAQTYYFVAATNSLANPGVALSAVSFGQVAPLIDKVVFNRNIVQTAVADGRFRTLVTALQLTGLDAALSGPGPFTVFAPTDAAFRNLPAGVLDSLIANPDALAQVLLYHVSPTRALAADVVSVQGLETLLGGRGISVTVNEDGVFLNGSVRIIITDIQTSNGVIHVIDSVLVP